MQDLAITVVIGAGSHRLRPDLTDQIEDCTHRARMSPQSERVSDLMNAIRSALEIVVAAER